MNDRLGAWGKALKRLFLCSHYTNGFFCRFIHPLTQKNKQDKFEDSLSCLRLSYNLSE